MNHAIDIRMRFEDLVEVLLLSNIDIVELGSLAADEFNAIDDLLRRIVQIVRNDDLVVGF